RGRAGRDRDGRVRLREVGRRRRPLGGLPHPAADPRRRERNRLRHARPAAPLLRPGVRGRCGGPRRGRGRAAVNRTDRSPGAGGTAVAESAPGQSAAGGPPGADDVRRIPLAPCLAAGLAVLLAAMVLGASVGPLYVPFAEVVQIVAGKLGLASAAGPDQRDVSVVWQLRVPRVLLGAMVGAALAMSGAALQSLFNNPLADPGIIGVSGGASTGAVAVIVLAGGTASAWPVPLGAFAAGLGVSALIYALARPGRTRGTARLLLVGIAVGSGCQALTGFFTYIADDAQLQTLTFWQMGSLGKAGW